jgi:hypothetical protein
VRGAQAVAEGRGGLAVLLPSYLDRCPDAGHRAQLAHVLERLEPLCRSALPPHDEGGTPFPLPVTLWIGMQHGSGQGGAARERLEGLRGMAVAYGIPAVGLLVPAVGKVETTNAALRVAAAAAAAPRAWLWLDDDVTLEADCLPRLVAAFVARDCRGAVGARVRARATEHRSSHLLAAVARHTVPRHAVPQACCEIVEASVLAGGIPRRVAVDDGCVLFRLLDPAAPDPFAPLAVVEDAVCHVVRGGGGRETLRRLRCSMYSHVLHLAEYPWATGRIYLREQLLYGWWPLGRPVGAGWHERWARQLAKTLVAGWLAAVAGELVVRGAVGRPRRAYPGTRSGGFWSHTARRRAVDGAVAGRPEA